MNKNCLYKILGVTEEEKKLHGPEFEKIIKDKYRSLSLEWHPDTTKHPKDEAEEKFKSIAEAYATLSNGTKRREYDFSGSNSGFNFANFHDDDLMDYLFQQGFGMGRRQQQPLRVHRGADIVLNIHLDVGEVINGHNKKYKFKVYKQCTHCGGGERIACPSCNGTGMITHSSSMGYTRVIQQTPCGQCQGAGFGISNSCNECNREGVVKIENTVDITIPKGMAIGAVLTINGEGHQLPKVIDGTPGDLKVVLTKINSNGWNFEGYDCFKVKEIPIIDIILGCDVEIVGIRGEKLKVTIPKNTKDDSSFRLVGKGLPMQHGRGNGDGYLIIKYKFPTNINKEERKILEKLKNNANFK